MGQTIVKIPHKGRDYYLLWSSIVDAPVTYGCSLEELEDELRFRKGNDYMEYYHNPRMKRVEKHGTSSLYRETPEEHVKYNRAGPGGTCLTFEGLVLSYIELQRELTPEEAAPYIIPDENEDD